MNARSFFPMPAKSTKPDAGSPDELKKGDRTRAAIIEAANRIFLSKGYHAASMRQITKEVHLALGGIYNYFDSKEDIFIAVL
ncbi:MAG: helix-turn-helix transcriptional regulator, partial [Chloroflexi bacterium]|nr:helix-turn-helix transcriptional regulator [Chloroflexota bacterium]